MPDKKEALNKKDLKQVAGGGLGASKTKKTSGELSGELFDQYQQYFCEEMKQGRTPMQPKDWLIKRGNNLCLRKRNR